MTDFTHLDALLLRLSHERARLAASKSQKEREHRTVWAAGIEREIAAEYKFLGIEPFNDDDDELLRQLST
jgi:hypothetical protein